MIRIHLGLSAITGKQVYLRPLELARHMHLIGSTGSGKSTAIKRIIQKIALGTGRDEACIFLIDPMGTLSRELLHWMAHPTFCTESVRKRLVYIEPANEDYVTPLNPLAHTSEANRYYQTMRAIDIVLRAWDAQSLAQQPRLAQWLFNSFYSAAAINIPIAMCEYLLRPGTPEHEAILNRIPGNYRLEWDEMLKARGEAVRILESTRNRLKPFFVAPNLRRMFGTKQSLFDCERMIRERRIVIVNLGKYGKLPGFAGDTIGGLVLNEIIETSNRLSTNEGKAAVDPTYVVMDEFQKYVSPDMEDALPTVRQQGLRFIMAHQSFSQLERADVDLTTMIWQAQSRLIFSNAATDADISADELAKRTFQGDRIKHELYSTKTRIAGYRTIWLESQNESRSQSDGHGTSRGANAGTTTSRSDGDDAHTTRGSSDGESSGTVDTHTDVFGYSNGRSQHREPIHEEYQERSNVTFESFDEWMLKWGQRIRGLDVGRCFATFPGRLEPEEVQVAYREQYADSAANDRVAKLLKNNFTKQYFLPAVEADDQIEQCRKSLLIDNARIVKREASANNSPFR